MTETLTVSYRVMGVEAVRRASAVKALATVLLEISGIEILLQGITVRRQGKSGVMVEVPQFRHPDTGEWLPCIALPDEVGAAIAEEVLELATAKTANSAGRPCPA